MFSKLKKNCRVLLVDDNMGDTLLIREILAGKENSLFELAPPAGSLDLALKAIDSARVDIILLDLSLPDSTGIETFRAIHTHAPFIPIIVLSGLDDEELSLQTLHEGAQDYLVKGQFDERLLTRAMRYASERQVIEEVLAKERNLLRNLVDNIPDYIYAKDPEGRYVIDNTAHFRQLHVSKRDDVIGKTVFDFFPKEIAKEYHAYDQAIMASGKPLINHEEPGMSADGSARWVATTKVPLRDPKGNIAGLVCISRDITQQKLAEQGLLKANAALAKKQEELLAAVEDLKKAHDELRSVQLQLIEAEKMKSIGRLAAGVAHEVKNPLAIITMGVAYLENEKFSDDSNVPGVLHDISDAVKRADAVIRGLLDFSVPKKLEVQASDLNTIIGQALLLVRGEMQGDGFRVVKELQPDLPLLKIDAAKISQVFINIFTNAIHSMGEGGTLTVRTSARQLAGVGPNIGDSRSESFRVGDNLVTAEVDDTGPGVPEDRLAKIFDPFFTTKPTGKGTGLGLTVTKSIIDLHGGTIDIRNRAGGGARVTIMLKA
jgi:PAS domain S-box-containing protein